LARFSSRSTIDSNSKSRSSGGAEKKNTNDILFPSSGASCSPRRRPRPRRGKKEQTTARRLVRAIVVYELSIYNHFNVFQHSCIDYVSFHGHCVHNEAASKDCNGDAKPFLTRWSAGRVFCFSGGKSALLYKVYWYLHNVHSPWVVSDVMNRVFPLSLGHLIHNQSKTPKSRDWIKIAQPLDRLLAGL